MIALLLCTLAGYGVALLLVDSPLCAPFVRLAVFYWAALFVPRDILASNKKARETYLKAHRWRRWAFGIGLYLSRCKPCLCAHTVFWAAVGLGRGFLSACALALQALALASIIEGLIANVRCAKCRDESS
jgi:hypothetical protein